MLSLSTAARPWGICSAPCPAARVSVQRSGVCLRTAHAAPRSEAVRVTAVADEVGDEELARPETRYMGELNNAKRKELRKQSQTLVREKKICEVNLGKNGITQSFIHSMGDALAKNEFVKVKIGNCMDELEDITEEITALTDSALVHRVGFTQTFYRPKNLPRPTSTQTHTYKESQAAADRAFFSQIEDEFGLDDDEEEGDEDEEGDSRFAFSGDASGASSRPKKERKRRVQPEAFSKPSAFEVL